MRRRYWNPGESHALLMGMHVRVCRCCGASLPHSALAVRAVHHLCEACSSLEESDFNSEVPLAGKEGPELNCLNALAHWVRGTKKV